jgi:hypothetical protein
MKVGFIIYRVGINYMGYSNGSSSCTKEDSKGLPYL